MNARNRNSALVALAAVLIPLGAAAQEGTLEWNKITSSSLGETREYGIYLPPSYHTSDKHYPSFYVLHGITLDATSHAGIRVSMDRMIHSGEIGEMIAVLVDGDSLSFYINEHEPYIVDELVKHIDAHYRTMPDRDSRGVTGFSMGAFGSLHLAFVYPEVFSVAVGQAIAALRGRGLGPAEVRRVVGELYRRDVGTYLSQPQRLTGLKIVHGVEDPGPGADIDLVREHHRFLLDNGVEHTYVEHPGGHQFLDAESLTFLSDHLQPLDEIARLRQSVVSVTETLPAVRAARPTPAQVEVVLEPAGAAAASGELMLDLTPLGGTVESLVPAGVGRYSVQPTLTPPTNGRYQLPILMETAFAWDFPGARYRLRTVGVDVYPAADEAVYVDACTPDWAVSSRRVGDFVESQSEMVHSGGAACTATGAKRASGAVVEFTRDTPLDAFGYRALRFAIHPGDASFQRLSVRAGRSYLDEPVDLLAGDWLNVTRPEWQVVEVPMTALGAEGPVLISLTATFTGSYHLDDLTLVAGDPPPPPSTAVVGAEMPALPASARLEQNFPNPFNGGTVIRFALPAAADVRLEVHNLVGQQVAMLAGGRHDAGTHAVRWDGRDDDGRQLASGVYLYRLRAGGQMETRRLLLMK